MRDNMDETKAVFTQLRSMITQNAASANHDIIIIRNEPAMNKKSLADARLFQNSSGKASGRISEGFLRLDPVLQPVDIVISRLDILFLQQVEE